MTPTTTTTRYKTRNGTAQARREAAAAKASSTLKSHTPSTSAKIKTKRKRGAPRPSKRPKRVLIAPSQICGSGNGLYLLEEAKKGEWIARYSGDVLSKAECDRHHQSHYRMQVHNNLFLDAEKQPKTF